MGEKIIDLWKTSSLIQGTLALATTGAIIYLSVTGQEVPETLTAIVMATVGFYFGTKTRQANL
ncbi:hypothetical protein ES705_19293 [subsurface metagenome]